MLKKYFQLFNIIFLLLILSGTISAQKFSPPEWSYDKAIYEVNIRQYTEEGNFEAFKKHLPKLKELGADILWLMPINPIGEKNRKGTLGSYYSVKDYKAVNPEFGTLEEFKTLVTMIHKMGMYVIIDWVANHTAWDNRWVEEHPEFYTRDSLGNIIPPNPDWTDVADLNYNNKELWAEMIDAMKFWVEECDIDVMLQEWFQ
jgi:glycosidase